MDIATGSCKRSQLGHNVDVDIMPLNGSEIRMG
jgi:hypothetical protein